MPTAHYLLYLLALLAAAADAGVLQGSFVGLTSAVQEVSSPIVVTLRVPLELIGRGVCVDMDPITSAFAAEIKTICTSTDTFVTFDLVRPGVYSVRLRLQSRSHGIALWDERAVVLTVLSGNLSMARAMSFVMLFGGVLTALFVFIVLPLHVMPLPFEC
jgi:hypothetical protein